MRRTLLAGCILATLGLSSFDARAEEEQIQVLSVMSDEAFDEAQALTVALKRAANRAGWELDAGEYSLEVMVASFNCPESPDVACMKKIAKKINSDHFVWGTLSKSGKQLKAHLRLWQEGKNTREAKITYAANLTDPNDDALMKVAEDAVRKLSGAAPGTVVLAVGSIDGQVFVDGEPAGDLVGGHAELQLPAGEHEIRVTAEGYNDAIGTISVLPGLSVELPLSPTKEGAEGGPGDGDGAADSPGDGPSMRQIAGVSAIGLGGVLGATGLFFTLKVNSTNNDPDFQKYKQNFARSSDACDAAEPGNSTENRTIADLCSSASSAQTLQWVFYALGAVGVGAGAYLLLTDPGKEKVGSVRVHPGLGPEGGGVDVRVAF